MSGEMEIISKINPKIYTSAEVKKNIIALCSLEGLHRKVSTNKIKMEISTRICAVRSI